MKNKTYLEIPFKELPIKKFGICPVCQSSHSKIMWGWAGVYYELICEKGHQRKYNDNRREEF